MNGNLGFVITTVFSIFIIGVFIVSLYWLRKDIHNKFVKQTPSLLTSIGILGTFVGITIGLWKFNPAEIDKSISFLLSGLELAFLTSLCGISFSIFFKILSNLKIFLPNSEKKIIDLEDLFKELEKINNDESQECYFKKSLEYQKSMNYNLVKNQELLNGFLNTLSKSATEEIIKALSSVVKDFNQNIKEEFGENFKKLDKSVENLNIWQEKHIKQLENSYLFIEKQILSINNLDKTFVEMEKSSKSILAVMNKVEQVTDLNLSQINELKKSINTLAVNNKNLSNLLPSMNESFKNTLSSIEKSSKKLDLISNNVSSTATSIGILGKSINKVDSNSKKAFSNLIEFSRKTEEHFENLADDQSKLLEEIVKSLDNRVMQTYNKMCESIENQHSNLQKSSENHIHDMANAMGEALNVIMEEYVREFKKLEKEES